MSSNFYDFLRNLRERLVTNSVLESLGKAQRNKTFFIIAISKRGFVLMAAQSKGDRAFFHKIFGNVDQCEAAFFIFRVRSELEKRIEGIAVFFPPVVPKESHCHVPEKTFGNHDLHFRTAVRISVTVGYVFLIGKKNADQCPLVYLHTRGNFLKVIALTLSQILPLVDRVSLCIFEGVSFV